MKALPAGCILRPLSPADEPALLEFFRSHSAETIFQRYHHAVEGMSHERARALLDVDQRRDIALAILRRVAGGEQIVAIGRYYTDPDGQCAEMALVVRESMRRRGLATRLLYALGVIAREHGLPALRAQVLISNAPMRNLLRPHASRLWEEPGLGTACFVVPVSALAGPRTPASRSRKRTARPRG